MWGTAWDKSIIFCIILLPPAGFGSCANILFMNKMFPLSYHIMCFLVFSPLQQCLLMSCCVRSRPNWMRLGRSLSSMSILPTSDLTATHQRSANTRSASTRRSCVLLYGVHHALSDIFPFFLLQLPFNSSSDEKKKFLSQSNSHKACVSCLWTLRCEPLGGHWEWSNAAGPQRSGQGV